MKAKVDAEVARYFLPLKPCCPKESAGPCGTVDALDGLHCWIHSLLFLRDFVAVV